MLFFVYTIYNKEHSCKEYSYSVCNCTYIYNNNSFGNITNSNSNTNSNFNKTNNKGNNTNINIIINDTITYYNNSFNNENKY